MVGNVFRVQGPVPNMVIYPKKKPDNNQSEKNMNGVWDVRHYHQGLLQGPSKKGNLTWFDQKVKKKTR